MLKSVLSFGGVSRDAVVDEGARSKLKLLIQIMNALALDGV